MKKLYILAPLAALMVFSAVSCEKEEVLEPSNIEQDWAEGIDLSNSYVKQLYQETGVALLTEFDDTADVLYQGAEYGLLEGMVITHLDPADKDRAIEWLKTNILDCFSTECIKKYFPRRIFVCKSIKAPSSTPGFVGSWIMEMKYANNLWGTTGLQHAFPFAQGWGVSVNCDELYNTETKIDYNTQYRVDIMNLFCDELFMKNDWLTPIQDDENLFHEDLVDLYGRNVLDTKTYLNGGYYTPSGKEGMYRTWYGFDACGKLVNGVLRYGDEITMLDKSKMTLEGYFEFGFPETGQNDNKAYGATYFRWPTGSPTTWTSTNYDDYSTLKTKWTLTYDGYCTISGNTLKAPNGPYRDVRNLICALCDLNEVKLTVYGEFLITRLTTLNDYFNGLGIDFKKFNPTVSKMYETDK